MEIMRVKKFRFSIADRPIVRLVTKRTRKETIGSIITIDTQIERI